MHDRQSDGLVLSKIGILLDLQVAGDFVLLVFVGFTGAKLSMLCSQTHVAENGHDVPIERLQRRFPWPQRAIAAADQIANTAVLTDNSKGFAEAFTVCQVQAGTTELFSQTA